MTAPARIATRRRRHPPHTRQRKGEVDPPIRAVEGLSVIVTKPTLHHAPHALRGGGKRAAMSDADSVRRSDISSLCAPAQGEKL